MFPPQGGRLGCEIARKQEIGKAGQDLEMAVLGPEMLNRATQELLVLRWKSPCLANPPTQRSFQHSCDACPATRLPS